ncbi:MAG: aminomethyl-transferring glycine dehydrogenase subunit GcvPA [Euryarchaeota archaeon]|nr:aminomethyl-transferring glycine dehydrogenase subunit GcvPA [Euryarchaeota archaeon]
MNDLEEMLKAMGLRSWEELYSDVPREVWKDKIDIPSMTEIELYRYARALAEKNRDFLTMPSFLGAGVYIHYIPPAVLEIAGRSEFYTSYTPYQAEISQGMLQTLFEYQSVIAELTGMDVANSSMYDASTALAEAARMAYRINRRKEVLVPENLYWEKESVLKNYIAGLGMQIKKYPLNEKGMVDIEALKTMVNENTAMVYVETPNFFGVIDEKVTKIKELLPKKTIYVVGVNPLSLAILKAPGEYGADIVVGEGQILGNPASFGGPLLGIFATRKEYVRKMPGRLIGETVDAEGRRAFVMTLQTREQHIRRGKATSNICSNEALCAVLSVAYVAYYGANGLKELAKKNMDNARMLMAKLRNAGFRAPVFDAPHFNEFLVELPGNPHNIAKELLKYGVHGGLPVNEGCYRNVPNSMLLATTEMHREEDMDKLVSALREVV